MSRWKKRGGRKKEERKGISSVHCLVIACRFARSSSGASALKEQPHFSSFALTEPCIRAILDILLQEIYMLSSPAVSFFIRSFPAVGFSGSRTLPSDLRREMTSVVPLVAPSAEVIVGCARGADQFFHSAFPRATVLSVASGRWGRGRSAFAARSAACVRAVASRSGLWISFPASPCPPTLRPSASSSRCFSGSGSGSWASLALALGSGVPCLICAPSGVPSDWLLLPVPSAPDWYSSVPLSVARPTQLALF